MKSPSRATRILRRSGQGVVPGKVRERALDAKASHRPGPRVQLRLNRS